MENNKLYSAEQMRDCWNQAIRQYRAEFNSFNDFDDYIALTKPVNMEMVDMPLVTRVEVIDHSPKGVGRVYGKFNCKQVQTSLQDNERTLKIFIK